MTLMEGTTAHVPVVAARPATHRAPALLASLRPKQWLKNVLVFAAPGAAGVLHHPRVVGPALAAFVGFCLVASAAYLFNDVLDADADRLHPVKCHRPIAAGELPAAIALLAATALALAAVAIGLAVHWQLAVAFLTYLVLSASYSAWLKRVAIVDIVVVASGFVLRTMAGAAATSVPISNWFFIVASFGSLFMIVGKRQAELGATVDGSVTRSALAGYSDDFLAYLRSVTSGVVMVGYCLWAFEKAQGSSTSLPWFQLSIVPFVLAVLRYAQMISSGAGEAPEDVVTSDAVFLGFAGIWVVVFLLGVYRA